MKVLFAHNLFKTNKEKCITTFDDRRMPQGQMNIPVAINSKLDDTGVFVSEELYGEN